MARDFPGVKDKAAFCAALERGEVSKREMDRLGLSKREVGVTLQIAKVDRSQPKVRTITGWATITRRDDGNVVVDADEHILPVQVLKRAVQEAGLDAGADMVGVNHELDERGAGGLAESFVFTNELKKAINSQNPDVPFFGPSRREGWMAVIRVTDPAIIDRIDSGELSELSLLGEATDWEEVD